MILSSLYALYERLVDIPDSGIAMPGYTETPVVAALELSPDGRLVGSVPLGIQKGKTVTGLRMMVPERVKRSAGSSANFLCDPAEYMLGVLVASAKRAKARHNLCQETHQNILSGVNDPGAKAVLSFMSSWDPESYEKEERLDPVRDALNAGGNLVFRLHGDSRFVHDRPEIRKAWESYRKTQGKGVVYGQCLVTGSHGPVARLHKSIMGVRGAQSTGASLVSFNFASSESYGKKQGSNSPVSEKAAFAYGTALNWLTANPRHCALIGDTTTVFWAERTGIEEDLMLSLFGEAFRPPLMKSEPEDSSLDDAGSSRVKSILERIVRGRAVPQDMAGFDPRVRFFVLGLAPNAARISVRFWHVDTFGGLLRNISRHYEDMAMVHREFERPVTVGDLVLETAPAVARKRENIPQTVIGALMRAILDGTLYPQSLYAALLARIRVDRDDPERPNYERKVNYPRASFLKAHLRRRARITGNSNLEEVLTEMLNEENRNPGYLLGRLFALLEKAQLDANKGIKATIKDRYYASASATPGSVFPVLIRLAQHHIAKAEHGRYTDKLIEGVLAHINSFPAHLDLEQQGLFALGYYQQKADLYKKRPKNEQEGGEDSE